MITVAPIRNGIKAIMERRKITGYRLAMMIGKPANHVYRIAKEDTLPEGTTIQTLVEIADALEVSIDELVGRSKNGI